MTSIERDGEHVTRAESEEILQIFARPLAVNDEIAAEEIASCGDKPEHGGEQRCELRVVRSIREYWKGRHKLALRVTRILQPNRFH